MRALWHKIHDLTRIARSIINTQQFHFEIVLLTVLMAAFHMTLVHQPRVPLANWLIASTITGFFAGRSYVWRGAPSGLALLVYRRSRLIGSYIFPYVLLAALSYTGLGALMRTFQDSLFATVSMFVLSVGLGILHGGMTPLILNVTQLYPSIDASSDELYDEALMGNSDKEVNISAKHLPGWALKPPK